MYGLAASPPAEARRARACACRALAWGRAAAVRVPVAACAGAASASANPAIAAATPRLEGAMGMAEGRGTARGGTQQHALTGEQRLDHADHRARDRELRRGA